jgi:hypothetical protein
VLLSGINGAARHGPSSCVRIAPEEYAAMVVQDDRPGGGYPQQAMTDELVQFCDE